ncbi:MAG TPA: hypothetical protein VIM01_09715, partial [Dermatophilaceae bacterium]
MDELYQQYLQDKTSVDEAWWEFFADYQPSDPSIGSANRSDSSMPAAPVAAPVASVAAPVASVAAPAP